MKNYIICILYLIVFNITSISFANEWIPYQNQYIVQHQPVIVQPQPTIVYQWVPYTVQQTYIVNQLCLFRIKQTVITVPSTQWIIQPTIIYR